MLRIFYASAGQADLATSHLYWRSKSHNPNEVSITFSSQIEDFVEREDAVAYFITDHKDASIIEDGRFIIENRPRPSSTGPFGYYWTELKYCLGLVRTAMRFKADVALLDSGSTPFFMMTAFKWAGIDVVPILHNCLWAKGFRPTRFASRIVQLFDRLFWRFVPKAVIAVSPEAERQISEIVETVDHRPIYQIRAQFRRDYFADILPPDLEKQPLEVMFIGRVVEEKGVLDIPQMARRIEDLAPGEVHWTICGRGDALGDVKSLVQKLGVDHVVDVLGWVSLEQLKEIYAKAHVSIVPTRSGFAEGLAMTAAEAILAGRPIVSNPIVPALEILASAAVAAESNNADSHADAVLKLARDRVLYGRLQVATNNLREQFYDRSRGLAAVLAKVLA